MMFHYSKNPWSLTANASIVDLEVSRGKGAVLVGDSIKSVKTENAKT